MKLAPCDIEGKDLKIGDWVRVLAVPISIQNMPDDTKRAFSKAVGETLQIESFNDIGCLELDFWPKLGLDTIWLEPYCVKRFRRYKKFSKRFKKILELNKELERPRLTFKFKAVWPKDGSHDEGVNKLSCDEIGIGYGWSVWPDERRMEGDFSILQHEKHSMEKLEKCREYIRSIKYFDEIEVGEIEVKESNKGL
jgi:hypothetical protein